MMSFIFIITAHRYFIFKEWKESMFNANIFNKMKILSVFIVSILGSVKAHSLFITFD